MSCQIEAPYVAELCSPPPSFFPLLSGQTLRLQTTTTGAGATGGGCGAAGPELVYAVRVAAAGRVSIRVAPVGWNVVLKAGSGSGSCANDCVNDNGPGGAETRSYNVTPNTIVWAVVDGLNMSDSGAFTLDISHMP